MYKQEEEKMVRGDLYSKQSSSNKYVDKQSGINNKNVNNQSSSTLSPQWLNNSKLYSRTTASSSDRTKSQSSQASSQQFQSQNNNSPPLINNNKMNLPLIYQKLIQHQHRCQSSMVDIEINPQSQLYICYKTFVGNLQVGFSRKQVKQSIKVYNVIDIVSPQSINWEGFQVTALAQLKVGRVKYVYNSNNSNQVMMRQKHTISNGNNNNIKTVRDNNNISNKRPSFANSQPAQQLIYQSTLILKHQPIKNTSSHQQFNKSQHMGQLRWQRAIIEQCFGGQYCIYVVRFFVVNYQQQRLIISRGISNSVSSSVSSISNNLSNNSSQQNPKQSTCCILSQFMRRGTLQKWLTQSSSQSSIFTKINLILYILYGTTFIHSKKVLHMDIKPQNILIDKNLIPKFTDFGSAYNKQVYQKMRREKHHYYLSFSIPYTAPEIFMKSHKPQINSKCDVFSLGLIMFQILFNKSIFVESNQRLQKMFKQIGSQLDKYLTDNNNNNHNKNNNTNNNINNKQNNHKSPQPTNQLLLKRIFLCPQQYQSQHQRCLLINTLLINLITRCLSCSQSKRPNIGMLIIAVKQVYQMFVQYYAW